MAFDGIVTRAMVTELREKLLLGKIDKIYQPAKDELVLNVHTRRGNLKLFATVSSEGPRVHLISENPFNPPVPYNFCMLMRRHLSGGRIVAVEQKDCERIIEISLETISELGFTLSKKLIFEIMGKHSNIILVDLATNLIIDSIKHVSIDTSRVRQVLPGLAYSYPPDQGKEGFDAVTEEELAAMPREARALLSRIGGISPQVAEELASNPAPFRFLAALREQVAAGTCQAHIYQDATGKGVEYHVADLREYESACTRRDFPDLSSCISAYYREKASDSRLRQSARDLRATVQAQLEKAQLKKQRLIEDIKEARNSEHLRLYGELLTANLHRIKPGASSVSVENYYDGSTVEIPLDPRFSAAKNAQNYYKRYGKSHTAVKEKSLQLQETDADIDYLASTLSFLERAETPDEIDAIRAELAAEGYVRKRGAKGQLKSSSSSGRNKGRRDKIAPYRYRSPSGLQILVGRNNLENDELTLKMAEKTDLWLHTKDIHGSHVILRTGGAEPEAADIYCAAAIAAWYSKARGSSQVPVDYVKVRYVKKPSGAKPGMVIFTNNRTVYVTPALPE
ncbi:MAG: NFACT family protein [Firmicutes bacterium]|nr:NFACT family protein [Bacillota bacterium]